jgi:hypothetical protein
MGRKTLRVCIPDDEEADAIEVPPSLLLGVPPEEDHAAAQTCHFERRISETLRGTYTSAAAVGCSINIVQTNSAVLCVVIRW